MKSAMRLSVIEVLAVSAFVAVLTFVATRAYDDRRPEAVARVLHRHADELTALQERYGPGNNSEHGEEWAIRDFFQDRRGGVFLPTGGWGGGFPRGGGFGGGGGFSGGGGSFGGGGASGGW